MTRDERLLARTAPDDDIAKLWVCYEKLVDEFCNTYWEMAGIIDSCREQEEVTNSGY